MLNAFFKARPRLRAALFGLVVCAPCFAVGVGQAFAQAPDAVAAPAFDSDRMSVEVVGSGPDVILIPGFASSREVWRAEADRLKSTHRVHLVQLAGFAAGHAVGPARGAVQAAEDVHQRGLARARGADDGHHLAGLDGQVDVLEHGDCGVTGGELPAQSPHLQQWLVHAHIPMGSAAGALLGPASPITTCSPASRPDSTWAWALVRRPMRTLRSATLPSPSRTRTV